MDHFQSGLKIVRQNIFQFAAALREDSDE